MREQTGGWLVQVAGVEADVPPFFGGSSVGGLEKRRGDVQQLYRTSLVEQEDRQTFGGDSECVVGVDEQGHRVAVVDCEPAPHVPLDVLTSCEADGA